MCSHTERQNVTGHVSTVYPLQINWILLSQEHKPEDEPWPGMTMCLQLQVSTGNGSVQTELNRARAMTFWTTQDLNVCKNAKHHKSTTATVPRFLGFINDESWLCPHQTQAKRSPDWLYAVKDCKPSTPDTHTLNHEKARWVFGPAHTKCWWRWSHLDRFVCFVLTRETWLIIWILADRKSKR